MSRRLYLLFANVEESFMLGFLSTALISFADWILDFLNWNGCTNPAFRDDGIGKIGTTGFVIGMVGGIHSGMWIIISMWLTMMPDSPWWLRGIWTWSSYMSLLCIFHFLEFFVTAVRQTKHLSYNAFIVNHGRSYTIAAIASWLEFWTEFYFLGRWKLQPVISWIGIIIVVGGQACRTIAMW